MERNIKGRDQKARWYRKRRNRAIIYDRKDYDGFLYEKGETPP